MRDILGSLKRIAFGAVLALLPVIAGPAQAANPLEKNFYLSGPRYDGNLPACESMLGRVSSAFRGQGKHVLEFGVADRRLRSGARDRVPAVAVRQYPAPLLHGPRHAERWQAAHRAFLDHRRRRSSPASAMASSFASSGSTATGRSIRPARLRVSKDCCCLTFESPAFAPGFYFVLEVFHWPDTVPVSWGGDVVMRCSMKMFRALVLMLFGCLALVRPAAAQQDRRQNAPGEFDFYVLALSWSPSFCEAAASAATRSRASRRNAADGRSPSSCTGFGRNTSAAFRIIASVPSPRLDRRIMTSMLDLMPAPGLIFNEWDKHGTCSGLGAARLFRSRSARRARR